MSAIHKAARNDPCPCGSGRRFKHCHGALPAGGGMPAAAPGVLAAAAEHLRKGNLPQAELLCRDWLDRVPGDPAALSVLGHVALRIGARAAARRYFARVLETLPDDAAARQGLAAARAAPENDAAGPSQPGRAKYLLIKAWGFGFWSDVDHVIGQLLLSEMTGRVPVVHWGTNSLFRSPESGNAFEHYFEPVSAGTIAALAEPAMSFYPPKWRADNLTDEDVAKWSGPHSRMAALHFLHRDEDVAVSDFHSAVLDLMPWIEPGSEHAGTGHEELHRRMFDRYIRLQPRLQERVEACWQEHMAGRRWLAVHLRGSDKAGEQQGLECMNREYAAAIDMTLDADPSLSVFLLTDSEPHLDEFRRRYGSRLHCTPATRTSGQIGVHYMGQPGIRIAEEVILDTYLAARCDRFLGNGNSNVSNAVGWLRRWPEDRFVLFEREHPARRNWLLHNR